MSNKVSISFSPIDDLSYTAPGEKVYSAGKEYEAYIRFKPANGEFKNLFNIIGKYPWSPIVFRDNYRRSANFMFSELIGLDYDDGRFSLDDAKEWVLENDFEALVGTTKSHLKKKQNGMTCDRFRIILRASSACRDVESYEYTLKKIIKETRGDISCKDAGRFFYPCKNIELLHPGKNRANWIDPPLEETRAFKQIAAQKIAKREWRDLSKISPAMWGHIMWGCRPPGRHKLCYIVGADLGLRGFSVDEIFKLLVDNKSPLLEIGANDVRRAITNGSNRANGIAGHS